jgi:hypothetical protein
MQAVVSFDCPSPQQELLLTGLVRLLEREPYIERPFCEFSQRYAWLLGYAAQLAERIILGRDAKTSQFTDAVLRAIELDAQAQCYSSVHHRLEHKLQDLISELSMLRHTLFWRAIERRRKELSSEGQRLTDWWQVRPGSLVRQLSVDDFEVFVLNICNRAAMDDRLVALTAAFTLWHDRGRRRKDRERMWRAVKGDLDLEAKLHTLLHPAARSEEERREWITRLRGNVDHLRSIDEETVAQVFGNLFHLGQEILRLVDSRSWWGSNRWDLLEPEFGCEVAEAAHDGLMAFWRLFEPPLLSERITDSIPNGLIAGLIGLAIEARERPGWACELSAQDAQRACRYALCELNGFPDWAPDLLAHPEAFDAVMQRELAWEFERPVDLPEPHYMVSTLRYGPEPIRERYRSIIQIVGIDLRGCLKSSGCCEPTEHETRHGEVNHRLTALR